MSAVRALPTTSAAGGGCAPTRRAEFGYRTVRGSLSVLRLCAIVACVLGTVSAQPPLPARADGGCIPNDTAGLVPRLARSNDMVCATPDVAKTVAAENVNPSQYWLPNGPYGPQTCVNGRVWREAFDGDTVCVTPDRRTVTWQENANAGVGNTGGLKPQAGFQPGGAPSASGTGGPDGALLAAVNDARTNPGKYPVDPNQANQGDVGSSAACPKPFADSGALDNTASTHNGLIAAVSDLNLVNSFPNMHLNPPPGGVLAWAPTNPGDMPADSRQGPIAAAGYSHARGEIVAIGQGSEADAVRFWMQEDGASDWGHRHSILNCGYTDAGAAHFAGGPGGNYWTVDLGAH